MYDKGKVVVGIAIFILLITFPIYYNITAGSSKQPKPSLDTPEIQALSQKQCVKPKDAMKAEHMQILNEWRDSVVRDGERYIDINGVKYEKSLQKTCLKCHSNKEKFCDECHSYTNVKPYCWDCHLAPKEKKQ
jgi:hypothetical protein